MNYRLMFTLNVVVVAGFGALFFGSPEFILNWFGFGDLRSTVLVAHFLGGALLVSAVFLWFLKDIQGLQKKTAYVLLAAAVVGFLFTILGMVKDNVITNGWVLLVPHLAFALGYAYLIFRNPVPAKEVNP